MNRFSLAYLLTVLIIIHTIVCVNGMGEYYSIYFGKEAISLDTQLYIDAMRAKGVVDAKDLQERSGSMSE